MKTKDRTIRDEKKYKLLVNMPWLKKGMIITWSDGEVNKESGTLANDISRYLSRLYRTDQDEWKLYFEELKQPEKQEIEIAEEMYSVNEFIYHLMKYNEDVDKKKYTKSQIATNIAKAMLNFFDETDVSY